MKFYTDKENPLSFNVDAPDRDKELYDYSDGNLPAKFDNTVGGAAVVSDGENNI